MKLYYLSLIIIFMFLIGCSTTYKVTNYFSKEDLYKKANSSMKSRDVNVVTIDSSFTAFEGSRIKDDSLQIVAKIQETLSLKDIKKIKYYGNAYEAPPASILLKSGKELNTENVKVLPDSSVQFINITNENIPLANVKHLNYTNHWVSMIPGFFGGAAIGAAIGATGWIIKVPEGGLFSGNKIDHGSSAVVGATFGIVIGIVVGAIIGKDYTYQFGP